jgi:DNA-binding transcriptional LysR family regulator
MFRPVKEAPVDLDWRWLRSFVAVASADTMTEAATASGISQPTLSRHIKLLENELAMTLFERTGRSLVLSQKGRVLLERAHEVRDAVAGFERQAVGESEQIAGTVRVTMHCMLGYHFAPTWLLGLRDAHPHISIDLVVDDRANLLLREADIAIGTLKPTQLDLIAQRVGRFMLGIYASDTYLRQHELGPFSELFRHNLIGFDRITAWLDNARAAGFDMDRESFASRTDAWAVHPLLIKAGLGMGVIPTHVGDAMGLTRVHPDFALPGDEIYLTAHPDLRRNPRIAIVWSHLRTALGATFEQTGDT